MQLKEVIINYHDRPNLKIETDQDSYEQSIMIITQEDVGTFGKITLCSDELSEIIELAKLLDWEI
jgi:hypothetical protein